MAAEPTVAAAPTRPPGAELVPPALLEQVVTELRRSGVDYGDVFVEDRTARSVYLDGDRVSYASHGRQRGLGIRAVRHGVSAHASTEHLTEEALLGVVRQVGEALDRLAPEEATVRLRHLPARSPSPVWDSPEEADWQRREEYVRRAGVAARAADHRITEVVSRLFESRHHIQIATTEGEYCAEDRSRVRLRVQVTAADRAGRRGHGSWAPGGTGGFEVLDGPARPEAVAAEAARQAVVLLDAREAPMGELPLVVSPGVGGVLLHEVCGHPLEADCAERPGAAFAGLVGEAVADPHVTVVDDQTLPGAWGSAGLDDEAVPSQRTVLVDGGVLTGYLHDRQSAARAGCARTGNGRRASFRHQPVPRMTNTFIAPGQEDPAQILRDTPDGIYAKSFSGGVADTATGSFSFTIREGYRIRHGRLAEPLSDIAIVGNGRQVLADIDRVGHDLALAPSICGKEGQKAMVCVGQPTIRISRVTIGGADGGRR